MIDLTLSGTYSVVVKRTVPDQPRREREGEGLASPDTSKLNQLISNELSVEITEPRPLSR